ncbi:unnamed protein product, partial [Meganyctiphanes norvegica]
MYLQNSPDLSPTKPRNTFKIWFLGVTTIHFHHYTQVESFVIIGTDSLCYLNVSHKVIKFLAAPQKCSSQVDPYLVYPIPHYNYIIISKIGPQGQQKIVRLKNKPQLTGYYPGWHFLRSKISQLQYKQNQQIVKENVVRKTDRKLMTYKFYMSYLCGRRPAFFIYLVIESAFGIATAWAPSFMWWLICRIGVGFTVPAIMATPMVLAIELVGPKERTYTTIIMNVAYSSTLIMLAILAYFIRDWAQLSLATTIPFLAFFLFYWVLPESPRWLLAAGRFKEAEKVMIKMARVNKKKLPENYMEKMKRKFEASQAITETDEVANNNKPKSYGVLDLFKTPNLCRKTCIITFIWFTNTSVYVGLSYYAPALGGDMFLNFLLAGVAELPTYIFLWPSMEYWGRRWTLAISMIIGGGACIATVVTQKDPLTTLILYCIGKFGISSSFVVLPLMASELYPTVVRGIGLSVSAVAGMIGPIIIPLINHLGSEMMVLPLIIMGVLLSMGGIMSLLLPETLHHHLPQTLEEGEEFGKNMTMSDYFTCCPKRPKSKKDIASNASEAGAAETESLKTNDPSQSTLLPPTRKAASGPVRPRKLVTTADSISNNRNSRQSGSHILREADEETEDQNLISSSQKITVV